MTKELCFVIDQISREKGISRDALLKVLEAALLSAVRKRFGGRTNIDLKIDSKTCVIQAYEMKTIVEKVENRDEEITQEEAAAYTSDGKPGDTVELPIPLHDLGRIAAQTAKQVIFQRVREAERDIIYEEFKDKIGHIVSGSVLRKEKNIYYISLGKTEAVLAQRDTLSNETLKRGDIVKAYLSEVRQSSKGPAIILSRTDPHFIVGLFKMEVPEINDGVVVIKGIAREPGERTKIAVYSRDGSIDAVGACVGMKGTRVQSIVRELRGERIDIIPWSDDPRIFIARALTPSTVDRVGINEEEKTAMVIADDQQLSLAIGKRGQNIKLATKLTGWEIEILSESEYSKIKMEETERSLDRAISETRQSQSNES
ncbi:MAG: transcription termination/antitermination protein NusA [Nitrospirales bacterium]|nr:transcription termination/antitermination protein NusA [Nitrospirales bacterium]